MELFQEKTKVIHTPTPILKYINFMFYPYKYLIKKLYKYRCGGTVWENPCFYCKYTILTLDNYRLTCRRSKSFYS